MCRLASQLSMGVTFRGVKECSSAGLQPAARCIHLEPRTGFAGCYRMATGRSRVHSGTFGKATASKVAALQRGQMEHDQIRLIMENE